MIKCFILINNDVLINKTLINGEGTVTFPEILKLDPKIKIFIVTKECATPYTCDNISARFKNNVLPYISYKGEAKHLSIDDGNHDCDSLNYPMVKYFKIRKEDIQIFFAVPPGITNRISITLKKE